MKTRIAAGVALLLLTGIAASANAGLSEDKNGVLHCSGQSSCNSLKTACENGKATYEQTGPTTGSCTVGSSSAALLLPAVQKMLSTQDSSGARNLPGLAPRPRAGIEPDEINAASRATAGHRVPARAPQNGRRSLQQMMRELGPTRAMLVHAQARPGLPQPGTVQARPADPPKYEIADCGTAASPMICCHHEDGDGSSCNLFKILCANAGGTAQGDGESAACSDW